MVKLHPSTHIFRCGCWTLGPFHTVPSVTTATTALLLLDIIGLGTRSPHFLVSFFSFFVWGHSRFRAVVSTPNSVVADSDVGMQDAPPSGNRCTGNRGKSIKLAACRSAQLCPENRPGSDLEFDMGDLIPWRWRRLELWLSCFSLNTPTLSTDYLPIRP
jgi:hypothetical protein